MAEDTQLFQRRVQQRLLERYEESATATKEVETKCNSEKQTPFSFQNIMLLILAIAVFFYTDFVKVLLYDQRIHRTWFWIGASNMSMHIGLCCFLAFYCNFFKKIGPDEWERRYPKAIPIATATFIIGILCLSIGLWPVWGILSPVIFAALFIGVVIIIAMIG